MLLQKGQQSQPETDRTATEVSAAEEGLGTSREAANAGADQ